MNYYHPLRQHQMVAVARGQVAARLRDADDRLARAQLVQAEAEVQIALQIERGHVDILGIIEPGATAQLRGRVGHIRLSISERWRNGRSWCADRAYRDRRGQKRNRVCWASRGISAARDKSPQKNHTFYRYNQDIHS